MLGTLENWKLLLSLFTTVVIGWNVFTRRKLPFKIKFKYTLFHKPAFPWLTNASSENTLFQWIESVLPWNNRKCYSSYLDHYYGLTLIINSHQTDNWQMAQTLTENWLIDKILTDNWHLQPPPPPIPDPPIIHRKYKYFHSTVQTAKYRRQMFHFSRFPFDVTPYFQSFREPQRKFPECFLFRDQSDARWNRKT